MENNVRLMIGEGTEFFSSETLLQQAELINDEVSTGRVEVCRSGEYRAVCGDDGEGWDNADAMVVCRELGFSPYGKIHDCICSLITIRGISLLFNKRK